MKRMMVAAALTTALFAGISPCCAQESTTAATAPAQIIAVTETSAVADVVAGTVAEAVSTPTSAPGSPSASDDETSTDDQGYWHDVEAQRGEALRMDFQGDTTFEDLEVEVSAPFQSFRTVVMPDQSILVYVPQHFSTAAKVAPVFTVLEKDEPVDTFTVSVEYSRPKSDDVEDTNPLFRLISDIAFRLPQLPFMASLLED